MKLRISEQRATGRVHRADGSQMMGAIMLGADQVEELICVLASWDHATLICQFQRFRSSFPVDCTDDFLRQLPVEKLRHVFLALCLQNQRMPDLPIAA